ncbi:MAG: hypothetical protein E6230_12705 [Paenibacillus dendritiformis]|uniref:hypothetical protein n=1 Tax=Paenibacillus dendritiformis TaxID=130049 RepID=UPI00143D4920|nr:hypothetical protein [Paenibacillus dendritiformis]MDU5143037.1 hypothetical protein [Paenibacillus dendritiformis]NKI24840.1 hypothetical protein [Paenibacillus dendritiformis]NRF97133.1 hypothetical protein [Paenibacillus dendritiformis]
MLTKAKELLPLMKRIIEYSGSIETLEARQVDGFEGNPEEMARLKQEYAALLESMSREDLLIIRAVADIGMSERGHRLTGEGQGPTYRESTFEIEIRSTPEELLANYHQYLVYHTKEQEIRYLFARGVGLNLSEGIQILELEHGLR